MRASLARIALPGLHGDDAAACDFTAEGAEKSAEDAEWMRTAPGKRSSAARSGFIWRWVQGYFQNASEACLAHEITKAGLSCQRQIVLPVIYDGQKIEAGYRLDLLIVSRMKAGVSRMVSGL